MIVLVVIGLIGWCAYRFLKKKKPKGAEDKKGEERNQEQLDLQSIENNPKKELEVKKVSFGDKEEKKSQ